MRCLSSVYFNLGLGKIVLICLLNNINGTLFDNFALFCDADYMMECHNIRDDCVDMHFPSVGTTCKCCKRLTTTAAMATPTTASRTIATPTTAVATTTTTPTTAVVITTATPTNTEGTTSPTATNAITGDADTMATTTVVPLTTVPLATTPADMASTTVTPIPTKPNETCYCQCLDVLKHKRLFSTSIYVNLTDAEKAAAIAEKTHEMQKKLKVPVETLSATIRRKTSARDDRPVAKAIGMVLGITVMAIIFGAMVISDLRTLYHQLNLNVARFREGRMGV